LWHDDAFSFVSDALQIAVKGKYNFTGITHHFWVIFLAFVLKIYHLLTGKWLIVAVPNFASALFGALLVFPVYKIAKLLFRNFENQVFYSLLTSAAVLANPVIWRWSIVAMSDIFSLFFILYSIYYFLKFLDANNEKNIIISCIFLYLSSMTRLFYCIVIAPFFIVLILSKNRDNRKKILRISFYWIITILLIIFSYLALSKFSLGLSGLFAGRSAMPTIKEIYLTAAIVIKSIGLLFSPFLILGCFYLYKDDKLSFSLLVSLSLLIIFYFASWYKNGFFDIERYSVLPIVILIIISCYVLAGNKYLRNLFVFTLIASLLIVFKGLFNPINIYRTYLDEEGLIRNYTVKASQISQCALADGDLLTYQGLSEVIKDGDVVFHWGNDWAMPYLLLSGEHLSKKAKLVSINSVEDLENELKEYKNRRVFLLRGVSDIYIPVSYKYSPIQIMNLNGNFNVIYTILDK